MTRHLFPLALVAASLALTACAQTAPAGASASVSPTPAGGGDLVGAMWLADAVGGQPPVAGTSVTAQFTADGAVSGSGGCNRYRGTYTVTGGEITIAEAIASTMMACEPEVMEQESAYFAALTAARTFAVSGDGLALSDASGAVVTSFVAQSQELAGTTWSVTGFNNGQGAVVGVLAEAPTPPSVSFGTDGTLAGSGGCNRLTGPFKAVDGTIEVGPLAATMMACPEPAGVMEQEAQLVAALETAATYSVEGKQLHLRTADDAIAATLTQA